MLEQYCVIYFGCLHIHHINYLKLVRTLCDEFEQVNGGCLMSYVFKYVFNVKSASMYLKMHR